MDTESLELHLPVEKLDRLKVLVSNWRSMHEKRTFVADPACHKSGETKLFVSLPYDRFGSSC